MFFGKELAKTGKEFAFFGKELAKTGKEFAFFGKESAKSGKEFAVFGKELIKRGKELLISDKVLTRYDKESPIYNKVLPTQTTFVIRSAARNPSLLSQGFLPSVGMTATSAKLHPKPPVLFLHRDEFYYICDPFGEKAKCNRYSH